jgi:hypothetical protein
MVTLLCDEFDNNNSTHVVLIIVILAKLLTKWSRSLLVKLIIAKLVKKHNILRYQKVH